MEYLKLLSQVKFDFEKLPQEDILTLKTLLKEYKKGNITLKEFIKIVNDVLNSNVTNDSNDSTLSENEETFEVIDAEGEEFYIDEEDDYGVIKNELERTVYHDADEEQEVIKEKKTSFWSSFW